ncbi:MAG TPA: SDR family oxidoreductase [Dehalococcoidia bacterium]|nr:SDR family oxidoreductase [Dehalococcoidia bacterium]
MVTDTQEKTETQAQPQPTRRLALITGASSGIGEEFARQLSKQGYDVVIVARRRDRLEKLAQEIAESGRQAEIIEADLCRPEGVAQVVERLQRGDVGLLVNNAGFGTNGEFAAMPLERELEEIDLNIRALTQLSHVALQSMKEKEKGAIINVASTGAYQPVPYMSTYAATKAYVLSFSEGLHEEVKRYGVTVTCLCPGGTRTEFQEVAGLNERSIPEFAFMSSEAVVRHALKATKRGSAIATPGVLNKMTTNMNRVFPRFAVRKISGRMFKKRSG